MVMRRRCLGRSGRPGRPALGSGLGAGGGEPQVGRRQPDAAQQLQGRRGCGVEAQAASARRWKARSRDWRPGMSRLGDQGRLGFPDDPERRRSRRPGRSRLRCPNRGPGFPTRRGRRTIGPMATRDRLIAVACEVALDRRFRTDEERIGPRGHGGATTGPQPASNQPSRTRCRITRPGSSSLPTSTSRAWSPTRPLPCPEGRPPGRRYTLASACSRSRRSARWSNSSGNRCP